MVSCTKCSLLLAGAVIIVAWYLYVPVWEGHQQFSAVGAFLAIDRLANAYVAVGLKLGIDSEVNLTRWYLNFLMSSLAGKVAPEGVTVEEGVFDGVNVRIYRPSLDVTEGAEIRKPLRGLLYYHGGGWALGSARLYDPLNVDLVKRLRDIIIVSVEYRLAPEYPFPIPLEDCVKATEYFMNNAAKFDVDPSRIGIAGDSAGGNLAAAVSLKLRRRSPQVRLQVLIYPALQAIDFATPSYQLNAKDPLVNIRKVALLYLLHAIGESSADLELALTANNHTSPAIKSKLAKSYLNHDQVPKNLYGSSYKAPNLNFGNEELWRKFEKVFLDPLFAPLLADDLSGLPRALVITCQYDVLRDDGVMYARRLKEAGTQVRHEHFMIGFHGFFGLYESVDEAAAAFETLVKFLDEHL